MFGLNENDNKKGDPLETVVPNTPPAASSDDNSGVNPLNQPPFPPPLPTIPPATPPPVADTPADSSDEPAVEAVPSPVTEPVDTAPSDATDTMPEESALAGVDMSENYIDEGPKISKRKKAGVKSSHDTTAVAAPGIAGTPQEDELLKLKQQALQNLAPLVDKLDQSPEEKFKTTMMLIQASDNAELVQDAYKAANAIPEEKARAQALLDVVNEINYFTQHPNPDAQHEEEL